ncbi:MAG: ABC transporter permease [Spirochaetales bacterium]|nr:ABC transporter permease [Spirochaetales bacterium]
MTSINKFRLAGKYLLCHMRRYIFLLMAMSFGFGIIMTMTSLSQGMSQSIYQASQNHYAGHIFIMGFDKNTRTQARITRKDDILKAVAESGISPERIVIRTTSFAEGILYFAGNAVRQKYVYGVDWDVEMDDFQKLEFVSGGVDDLHGNSILISEPVAKELHARVGDDVILEVITQTGQKNTGTLIVKGIIRDTSIFGYYKCFLDRDYLNELLVYEKDEASSIGLYFNNLHNLYRKTEKLYAALKKNIPMGPPIRVKEDLTYNIGRKWDGIRYFTFPLHVYVSQVADLLTAMEIVSYFLYIMMIIIIVVSIFVTYRLILHERSSEIGTMRAIGFTTIDIQIVLLFELLIVFAWAIGLGFLFSAGLVHFLSLFSYSRIPGFEIFLTRGKLTAVFTLPSAGMNILILLLCILPAVWIPSFQAVRTDLTKALSGDHQ